MDKDTVKCNCTQRLTVVHGTWATNSPYSKVDIVASYTSGVVHSLSRERERGEIDARREKKKRNEGPTVHPVIYIFEVYQRSFRRCLLGWHVLRLSRLNSPCATKTIARREREVYISSIDLGSVSLLAPMCKRRTLEPIYIYIHYSGMCITFCGWAVSWYGDSNSI